MSATQKKPLTTYLKTVTAGRGGSQNASRAGVTVKQPTATGTQTATRPVTKAEVETLIGMVKDLVGNNPGKAAAILADWLERPRNTRKKNEAA
jgi:hypothetical protein